MIPYSPAQWWGANSPYLVLTDGRSTRYSVHIMNARDKEETMTLEILQVIDQEQGVTQRHLAKQLGVALGLANSYLKRCVRKGLIKIQQAPANRYLYYLTPKGFAEKSRLTAQYLSYSLNFYRHAVASCDKVFELCRSRGWNRVLLCGQSDLAEIAALRAGAQGLEIVNVIPWGLDGGAPDELSATGRYDVIVLTDLNDPAKVYEQISTQSKNKEVLVPDVLGFGGPTQTS